MLIWIFKMKKAVIVSTLVGLLCGCSWLYSDSAQGQVIYHWARPRTGIEKFSRDHSECMRIAEGLHIPDFRTWFFSEETKLDLRANWHAERGIWASYVAYPGAQPVMVRSLRDNAGSSPRKYRVCMEKRGYTHRKDDIPTTTNLYIYKPQRMLQDIPFSNDIF